jgi:hypothetical protein
VKDIAPKIKEAIPHIQGIAHGVGQAFQAFQKGKMGQPIPPAITQAAAPAPSSGTFAYTPSQAEKVDRTIQNYPPSYSASAYPEASFEKSQRYVTGRAVYDVIKGGIVEFVPMGSIGIGEAEGGSLSFSEGMRNTADIHGGCAGCGGTCGRGIFLPGQPTMYGTGMFLPGSQGRGLMLPGQRSMYGSDRNF